MTAKTKGKTKRASGKKPADLFSISQLAALIDRYPLVVKRALKGVTPVVDLPKLKQYRLTDKNPQGKTVKELLDEIEDPKLNEAKARSAIADAEMRELKLQKAKADLVPYADVRDQLQRVFHHLYQRLAIQQPREIASDILKCKTAREVTALLRKETALQFNALRTDYKRLFGSS